MKRLVLLAVVLAAFAPSAIAGPWIKSLVTAQKKAKDNKRLIFVDMFADWCGWCHRMEQEVFPSAAFQMATDDMVLLRLNTEDGGEGTQLAQKLGVTTLPTFLVLTHDLTVAGVIRGYSPPNDFVKMLTDVEKQYNNFLKLQADEPKFGDDYGKRLQLAQALHARQKVKESETRLKKLVIDAKAPTAVRDQAYLELAMVMFEGRRYDESLKTIREFTKVQSKGDLLERARMLGAQVYTIQGNYLAAANELRSFKATFPNSPLIKSVDLLLPQIEQQLQQAKK
ncbi:MAG TPA: thioredoxin fold domain-containing protein [Thermoanaerobaculia bacterium]|nr:thioredoxin fold domain-containing protein [Thermoanaerobaculia bacterium]